MSKMMKVCFVSRKPKFRSKCEGGRCNLLRKTTTQAISIKQETEMCADTMVNIKFCHCETKNNLK